MAIDSLDLSALTGYPGKYQKKLYALLYNMLDVFQDVTVESNLKSKLQMTRLKVTGKGKPYTGVFKATENDLQFLPRELAVEKGQRDITIDPDKYRGKFLEEFAPGPGGDAQKKTIPFAAFTWQTIIGELAAAINDLVVYHGLAKTDFSAWEAATAYVTGDLKTFAVDGETKYWRANQNAAADESPDTHPAKWDDVSMEATAEGYASRIVKAIANGDTVETAIGVIDNDNVFALAAFKELYRKVSDAYKSRMVIHQYCSIDDAELLLDDIETKLSKYTREDVTQGKSRTFALPGTFGRCLVHPVSWMSGSRRIITTPKENMYVGTDRTSDINSIATDTHVYTIDAGITWLFGTQIRDFDSKCFVINDQA